MKVSEIMALAISSELKQLAIKDDEDAILGFINLGVLELHKRFPLRSEEAILTLREGKSRYYLNGTDNDVSMVQGSISNLLLVSGCYDEEGDDVTVNDEDDELGIMTPAYNVIEVPHVLDKEKLSVIYQMSTDFYTSVDDVVELPPQLIEALLHYIGYRGHSTVSVAVDAQNNTHYIRFDQSCNRVLEKGLVLPDDMQSQYFNDRGFV